MSSFFNAPHPLVPLATFNMTDVQPAALEESGSAQSGGELALVGDGHVRREDMPTYSLFSSAEQDSGSAGHSPPDFLGRLHHLKTLFRMSATKEPVSVIIHRVGPLLILDDGPCGWSRGDAPDHSQPLPPLSHETSSHRKPQETDSQLMLAALDSSMETALVGAVFDGITQPPVKTGELALPQPPQSDLRQRICVKNTFLDVLEQEEAEVTTRTQSCPGRLGGVETAPQDKLGAWNLPLTPLVPLLQHPDREASTWSLIPYQHEPNETGALVHAGDLSGGQPTILAPRHWDLLQCSSRNTTLSSCSTALDAVRSLYSGIPPQPRRFGRSVEWRCGQYKVLLGCDLVVLHSDEKCESSEYASFKMLPPGRASEPTREEKLDVYLENLMCDITKAVWGSHHQGQTTWRVFNTADLPSAPSGQQDGCFDANLLQDQGHRLLHFLRQQCDQEGGTYWLFREQNALCAELFDLNGSPEHTDDNTEWQTSRAFCTTPSLAAPLATLCFHLSKAMPIGSQHQLLQKGLHLLEPLQQEHPALYSMMALQLACAHARAPMVALPDQASSQVEAPSLSKGTAGPPAAAMRLGAALRYLEAVLRLLSPPDEAARDALLAELRLQAHVTYAECIVKLVREACIPTYSAWLCEVQRTSQHVSKLQSAKLGHMKQLSAAMLLWRLFWLCRAQRALAFLSTEKRETECWILDRDLCETMGDTLYGLSRFPAEDVEDLLSGQMATADGICRLVEDTLRTWAVSAGDDETDAASQQPRPKRKSKRLISPVPSPQSSRQTSERVQGQNINAMYLSKLNPLTRGVGDDTLLEDPLVRDDLRQGFWLQGRAFRQSVACYERATARLRRAPGEEDPARRHAEDPTTAKVARKLAHLYNEEARAALRGDPGVEDAEPLLSRAHRWMMLSGDFLNASRVLLNLSEFHAQRAERFACAKAPHDATGPVHFSEEQYLLWLKAIECCEEAIRLSENSLGRRESAFAHLRLGVHLSMRVPDQPTLNGSKRNDSLAELAGRHFGKALRAFDELHEDREIAVCHFHMADLALQELRMTGSAPLPKARMLSALRHARRSTEYWERAGALLYAKDFVASHIRIARLLECQQRPNACAEAVEHLAGAEQHLLKLASSASAEDSQNVLDGADLFILVDGCKVAVTAFRKEMSRACQSGLRQGEDMERLKALYRRVLRNEPMDVRPQHAQSS